MADTNFAGVAEYGSFLLQRAHKSPEKSLWNIPFPNFHSFPLKVQGDLPICCAVQFDG